MIVAKMLDDYGIVIKEEISFSLENKQKYIDEFNYLKTKGVIAQDDTFEGVSWEITIAKTTDRLNFPMNEFFYRRVTNGRDIELSFQEFNVAFRRYILEMVYNAYSSGVIKQFMSYFQSFIEKTSFLDVSKISNIERLQITGVESVSYERLIDVLAFMNVEVPDEYLDVYEDVEEQKYESRKLPNFLSIFDFIEIIKDFRVNATKDELAKFYPIVLWWNISFIIPLRPSEILVTKYDCIKELGDKFYLTINRTTKKGAPNKYRTDKFDVDSYYEAETIEINRELYEEIDEYRKMTDDLFQNHKKEFLFSMDLYKSTKNIRKNIKRLNNQKFSSSDFKYLLDRFYVEIVQNKYNRTLLSRYGENSELAEQDGYIETLVPYDSRHIAIINLILMGNEHYTVMKMAGHNSLRTTKGYYDHLEEYTKAYSINYAKYLSTKTTEKFSEVKDFNDFSPSKSLVNWRKISNNKNNFTKVDGGFCTYHLKDFKPCNIVDGIHSRCKYFIEDKRDTILKEIEIVSSKISSDVLALKEIVNNSENIFRFSEKYVVLTQSIRHNMNTKALLISKYNKNTEVKNEQ